MVELCGIPASALPALHESYEAAGTLKPELAELWGLNDRVAVAAGAGDNAASAIGTGTVHDGDVNISLGTSGTVFIARDGFCVDKHNALHSFCHADGKYHLLGCILSAAACNGWWMGVLNSSDYDGEQAGAQNLLGKNSVYFLPYLNGERSPHNDVYARGAFVGLTPAASRTHMTLAVLEGVAFALRDCIEVAGLSGGTAASATRVCGGGAKSELWCNVLANVLNMRVEKLAVDEGAAYGAAMLAMVAGGEYKDVREAADALVRVKTVFTPSPDIAEAYRQKYSAFRALYPALKDVYRIL